MRASVEYQVNAAGSKAIQEDADQLADQLNSNWL